VGSAVKRTVVLIIAAFALGSSAYARPFAKADPKAGKKVYEDARCSACHDSVIRGNGDRIYTRPDHKIRSAKALLKQVGFCVNQTGAAVLPQDIVNIAAYLNQRFYKFRE